ncbi:MAG TPA: hypothetical protein VNT51_05710 [Miltoncostaeaceae bacterium]|nr:hypothetical protein [Miltoncostaeaceae bacterium]
MPAVDPAMLPVLALACLAGIALASAAWAGRLPGLRPGAGLMALALAGGTLWLVTALRADDGYYGPGAVSVWEHAGRNGSRPLVVGGPALAVVAAGLMAALAAARAPRWRPAAVGLAFLLAAGGAGGLLVAALAARTGH